MRGARWLAAALVVLAVAPAARAQQPLSGSGVVLMHGKAGDNRWIAPLADAMRQAGARVDTPLAPWSRPRIYDRSYADTMKEIDAAVGRLEARGAARIFVAGHSLGANVALGYGARREGLAGIVMIAPGHVPDAVAFQARVRDSVAEARRMVEAGRGGARLEADDFNQGVTLRVVTTASIYLSWFDAVGPAAMGRNARAFGLDTPVLWVAGKADPVASDTAKEIAYDYLPLNPYTHFLAVEADHLQTPAKAASGIVDWMAAVLRNGHGGSAR